MDRWSWPGGIHRARANGNTRSRTDVQTLIQSGRARFGDHQQPQAGVVSTALAGVDGGLAQPRDRNRNPRATTPDPGPAAAASIGRRLRRRPAAAEDAGSIGCAAAATAVRACVLFDVDDAVMFHNHPVGAIARWRTSRRFRATAKNVDLVVAGNDYLAEQFAPAVPTRWSCRRCWIPIITRSSGIRGRHRRRWCGSAANRR